MKIDQNKLRVLSAHALPAPSPTVLRREGNVFFVGGNLPEVETLETLYESHYQSHASLFHLTFGCIDDFHNGETLARMIKKNFNAHLMAKLDYSAPNHFIERAYAAGVDIIDIPLLAEAGEGRSSLQERLRAVECARSVFPRWSVVSTLTAREERPDRIRARIDELLGLDVVPLLPASGAPLAATDALPGLYAHLLAGWRKKKAVIKPLLPLIYLSMPFVPASAPGVLRGFIDIIEDRRLLATSDLRRLLRVKEVEQSYASSGL